MIGDEATGAAAVVDPQRDTDQYIAFAADHALQIKHVFLTHLHADFVAGHLELRDRADATIYLLDAGGYLKSANRWSNAPSHRFSCLAGNLGIAVSRLRGPFARPHQELQAECEGIRRKCVAVNDSCAAPKLA
jgi:glyoxylase-like metal-dependent hydrolase (beta-lactamase superfamily II)